MPFQLDVVFACTKTLSPLGIVMPSTVAPGEERLTLLCVTTLALSSRAKPSTALSTQALVAAFGYRKRLNSLLPKLHDIRGANFATDFYAPAAVPQYGVLSASYT